ncbi:acyl-CoA dehydrogenase family protein [Pseudomonas sp. RIT-PI-S]|uniref:acyl-CoA dehydrogenase family protein n=1 Tax=Pseudomonas sp. RIT-PI-S TaxID=3035295 RepID=UPI0021D9336D|nr:acyl-CoA dehydrogenase family protein [Pseudomonas sp. RIT-PI-S]
MSKHAASRDYRETLSVVGESPAELDIQQDLRRLMAAGLDRLPLPGSGNTLQRWRALADVAAVDLSLVKFYEGHTDALAILAELAPELDQGHALWAVWAAEPPNARVTAEPLGTQQLRLHGTKAWCSGAAQVDRALVTVWSAEGQPWLAAVSLRQPGIEILDGAWQAVGMGASASLDVRFDGAVADVVAAGDGYLRRPGFWQGGGGIAACWYGAAARLGEYLRTSNQDDPHTLAHLGAVDACLTSAAANLRECAAWIDANPKALAELPVRRVRAQIEQAVEQVLRHVGRALGATPFCRNGHFARLAADLPVFVRQSHAERDLAALGALSRGQSQAGGWHL